MKCPKCFNEMVERALFNTSYKTCDYCENNRSEEPTKEIELATLTNWAGNCTCKLSSEGCWTICDNCSSILAGEV